MAAGTFSETKTLVIRSARFGRILSFIRLYLQAGLQFHQRKLLFSTGISLSLSDPAVYCSYENREAVERLIFNPLFCLLLRGQLKDLTVRLINDSFKILTV